MSILRFSKGKKNPYFLMHNSTVNNQTLSLKAKGMLAYLVSKPDHWYVNYDDLVSASTDGITSVRSTIKELQTAGYLVRSQLRKENGQFGYYNFMIYEQPQKTKFIKNSPPPHARKRYAVNPYAGNGTPINTDKIDITERKKTTTTSVVLPDNAAVVSHHSDKDKKDAYILLCHLKVTDHEKIFELFTLHDILKYCRWMKERNRPVKNPTGFLITSIKEKWFALSDEEPSKRDELLWWYQCKDCKIKLGFTYERSDTILCNPCKEARKWKELSKKYPTDIRSKFWDK